MKAAGRTIIRSKQEIIKAGQAIFQPAGFE
jgi:hypothetical protein